MPLTTDTLKVTGAITCSETAVPLQTRETVLKQDPNVRFPVPWSSLRKSADYAVNLPATPASTDLGLVGGTFGSAGPMVQAGDLKAAGATTRTARFQAILPECYDPGETVSLIVSAGMLTTVADVSCTLDVEAHKLDKEGGVGADLCATAAQSINSLTFAEKTFLITPTGLVAGDVLDVRISIACNDAASATAVIPTIAGLDLACDIKG